MSLKAGRDIQSTKPGYHSDATATRGGCVSVKTVGSGESMDDSAMVAEYATAPSGTLPLGVLIDDVVNNDLTKVIKNPLKQEVELGEKVTICNRGWVTTNMVAGEITVSAPEVAYVTESGLFTNVAGNGYNVVVGRFDSNADEDGYCRVSINLP